MINKLNLNKILSQLKKSAKKRNIDFSLSITDLNELSYPIRCPILNIPLDYDTQGYSEYKPTIDRIDSSKGYSIDNIQVISFKANRAKNNLTEKELQTLSKVYI